jgi:hypothetical protein
MFCQPSYPITTMAPKLISKTMLISFDLTLSRVRLDIISLYHSVTGRVVLLCDKLGAVLRR